MKARTRYRITEDDTGQWVDRGEWLVYLDSLGWFGQQVSTQLLGVTSSRHAAREWVEKELSRQAREADLVCENGRWREL